MKTDTKIRFARLSLRASFATVLLGGATACAATDIRTEGLSVSGDEQTPLYSQHLFTLANEYMQGRKPGTVGIERAAQYLEFHFDRLGFEPAFEGEDGVATWRQRFRIGEDLTLTSQAMAMTADGARRDFSPGEDFNALGYGSSGEVELPVTFVGYSIPQGSEDYSSYDGQTDLSGQAARVASVL